MSSTDHIPSHEEDSSLLRSIPRSGDLRVPEGYFDQLEGRLLEVAQPEGTHFFVRQEEMIMAQIRLEGARTDSDLVVPSDYFEHLSTSIEEKFFSSTKNKKGSVRSMRGIWWTSISVAAAVVVGYFVLQPSDPKESLFQAMMESTPITYDDMPYFATEEDYEELCLLAMDHLPEGEEWQIDRTDSTVVIAPVESTVSPADTLNKLEIKPSGLNDTPTWDELTDEEILQYLLETGDDV